MLDPISEFQLAKLPLEELLLIMSYRDDDPRQAEKAFVEFHRRFKDYLWNYCRRYCKKLQDYYANPELTIFDNVMNKVYFKAGTLLKIDAPTEVGKNNMMRAWLTKTASNEIIDLFNENKQFVKSHDVYDDDQLLNDIMDKWQQKTTEGYQTTDESELVTKALNLLTDRERYIYCTLLELEEEHKYLPKEDVQRVANHEGITIDNLYQIRYRAGKKVITFIENNTKPTGDGPLRYIPRREED